MLVNEYRKISIKINFIYKKILIVENQLAKIETTFANLDYIKNIMEKTKENNMNSEVNELCTYMKKLTLDKENKIRKPVSPYAFWTKEELNKPPEYMIKFPKEFLKEIRKWSIYLINCENQVL